LELNTSTAGMYWWPQFITQKVKYCEGKYKTLFICIEKKGLEAIDEKTWYAYVNACRQNARQTHNIMLSDVIYNWKRGSIKIFGNDTKKSEVHARIN